MSESCSNAQLAPLHLAWHAILQTVLRAPAVSLSFLRSSVGHPFFDVAREPEATNKGFREQQYRQQFISFDHLRTSVIHTRALAKKRHIHTYTHGYIQIRVPRCSWNLKIIGSKGSHVLSRLLLWDLVNRSTPLPYQTSRPYSSRAFMKFNSSPDTFPHSVRRVLPRESHSYWFPLPYFYGWTKSSFKL